MILRNMQVSYSLSLWGAAGEGLFALQPIVFIVKERCGGAVGREMSPIRTV